MTVPVLFAPRVSAIDPKADLAVNPSRAERFITFPDGLEIACQSRTEAEHIHEDLFLKRVYLRNGITLWDGACIFDVGGNIGLFTLFAHLNYRNIRTYTFEPAPPLFEILRTNVGRHGGWSRLYHCGVSSAPGTAQLTFYPYSSGMSSFYADEEEEKDVLRTILEHEIEEKREGVGVLEGVSEEFLDARFTSQTFDCPLIPLSQIIRQEQVEVIDLLKVDVQKSELEVLRGLEPEDWSKVRQVVLEVHDLDGQLQAVEDLLQRYGFKVIVEQDPLLEGTVLYNLFAINQRIYSAQSPATSRNIRARVEKQRKILLRRRGGSAPSGNEA
jgi:FkbM family methyltransferase